MSLIHKMCDYCVYAARGEFDIKYKQTLEKLQQTIEECVKERNRPSEREREKVQCARQLLVILAGDTHTHVARLGQT